MARTFKQGAKPTIHLAFPNRVPAKVPSRGGNTGSNPLRCANIFSGYSAPLFWLPNIRLIYGASLAGGDHARAQSQDPATVGAIARAEGAVVACGAL